jgi:hypothetical protein
MSDKKTFSSFEEMINDVIKRLYMYDNNVLDDIFKNPTLTNIFLKTDNLKGFLFDYITTTKSKSFYELIEYFKNDFIDKYNNFKFYNGLFTQMDLKKLDDLKMLNTILLFNTKKTTNEDFNYIFNHIKDFDIKDYKFNDYFNPVLLNNIHNGFNFNFMKIYEHKDLKNKDIKICYNIPKIEYKYLNLMDNYILKFNDDSMLFKKWFYLLLSYVYDRKDLNIKDLLNIFQNFNIVFYHKLIHQNEIDDCLITFIYFKCNDFYKPNLRYTIDICGKTHEDKIMYLKTLSNKECKNKEFNTTIKVDDKGIYFNTKDYKPNDILKRCQDLINLKKYESLIYYIFNSQFLNRSTCLFGYFVYFYFTHQILKCKYFDIIALTEDFEIFKTYLNNDNVLKVEEFEKINNSLTLNGIIDLIN